MERFLYQQLLAWKSSEDRKPLLLQGLWTMGSGIFFAYLAHAPTLPHTFVKSIDEKNQPNRMRNKIPDPIFSIFSLFFLSMRILNAEKVKKLGSGKLF
jgi:hypothetical protein